MKPLRVGASENMTATELARQKAKTQTESIILRFFFMPRCSRISTTPAVPASGMTAFIMSAPLSRRIAPATPPADTKASSAPVQAAASPTQSGAFSDSRPAPDRMKLATKYSAQVKILIPLSQIISVKSLF